MKKEEVVEEKKLKETVVVDTAKGAVDGQTKCPKCGATDITYSEKKKKLRCNYCRHEFVEEKVETVNGDIKKLKGRKVGSGATKIDKDADDLVTIKCTSCGAEVVVDTKEALQSRCHWCRNFLSINNKLPNGAVPDVVLPFTITKDEARKSIEDFVGKRKFYAHPTFSKEFTTENIMGVFFPYMVVDLNVHSKYDGEAEILIRSYRVSDGNDSSHTEYDADLYNVSREFDLAIDNLTIESNVDKLNYKDSKKTTNIINSIMPFDIENSVKWDANYIKGYTSEKRDTDIDQLEAMVHVQAEDISRHACNPTIKKFTRGAKWKTEEVDIKGEHWNAAYLPVWLYSYQQENKQLHYVAVNARTKETMGSVPVNKVKLFLISCLVEFLCFFGTFFIDMDGGEYLLLVGGFVYYFMIYGKYRNSDARHTYEKETKTEMENLVSNEAFVKHRRGLTNPMIKGQNNTKINDKSFQQLAEEKMNKLKK